MKEKLLVSACLLGIDCKYSGGNNRDERVLALAGSYDLVPVCPEQLGGLPTPRLPSERRGERVADREGRDVTDCYEKGAEAALRIAQLTGCRRAVLKSRSPSCGCGVIYDGTFTGTRIPGDGVTAELLKREGIAVSTEEDPFL